jgi:hypothetical protein
MIYNGQYNTVCLRVNSNEIDDGCRFYCHRFTNS